MILQSYDAKLYYLVGERSSWGTIDDFGRYAGASPSMTLASNIGDIMIPFSKDKTDVTRRDGGGFKQYKGTLMDLGEITIPQRYDDTDLFYKAMLTCLLLGGTIALAILDGDNATAGTEGWCADFEVLDMEKGEKLNEIQMVNWKIAIGVGPQTTIVPPQRVIVT